MGIPKDCIPPLVQIVKPPKGSPENGMGRMQKIKGVEIYFLYNTAVQKSGLRFHPAPHCGKVYYADPLSPFDFIRIDYYFDNARGEMLEELQQIAYCMGAKEYRVEYLAPANHTPNIIAGAHFEGNYPPVLPILAYFTDNENLKSLVDKLCKDRQKVADTTYELILTPAFEISLPRALKLNAALAALGIEQSFPVHKIERLSKDLRFILKF